MGKELVREQLHVFIEDVEQFIHKNFRPLGIFGLGGLPGNGVLRILLRPIISHEVNKVKIALQNQFNTILDAAEEIDNKGKANVDFEKYYDRMLESELLFQNYVGDRKDEFEQDIKERLDKASEDIAPLIDTKADDFWRALVEAYDRDEAYELFQYHFRYYERLMDKYGAEEIKMTTDTLIPLDYTREAERTYPEAETMVREKLTEGYDEEYEKQAMSQEDEIKDENEKLRRRVDELEKEKQELEKRVEELRNENEELRGQADEAR